MPDALPRVRVDGRRPTADDLLPFALANDGHFTAMQVRDGAARGVDRHLARLSAAHHRLYGVGLDTTRLRELMREAVREHPDCSLRVTVAQPAGGPPRILTVVRPASDLAAGPAALRSTVWARGIPEVKHVGTFPQIQLARDAARAGYHDALLVTATGEVGETTIANIAFLRGEEVVWPAAPSLRGITQELLIEALPGHGYRTTIEPVRLADVGRFDAAVLSNSIGVAPVDRIDDHRYSDATSAARALDDVYRSIPAQPL
jgi:branched-subunit amino acid aminotransferase/4-amino-4-deoxychorismate lyase